MMRWTTSLFLVLLLSASAHASRSSDGKRYFELFGCNGCHTIGNPNANTQSPDLFGLTNRRTKEWLQAFIKNPQSMSADPEVQKMKRRYPFPMPALGLTDQQIDDVIIYLASAPKSANPVRQNRGMMMNPMHGDQR